MMQLTAGLILFLGIHSVSIVAPAGRDRLVERIGKLPWRGIYAVCALAGLVLIVKGYADVRNQTTYLYVLPRWINAVTMTLMLPVFPLLLATYLPGGISAKVRHPTLVAVKLWAFAHLLANGSVADVLLFGSVLAWAVADRISLKRRPPRAVPAARPGPWNDVIAIVGGLFIYSLMIQWGHALLIGMPLVVR